MKMGFTGSRKGMTKSQLLEFKWVIHDLAKSSLDLHLHHGDCMGADCEAHFQFLESLRDSRLETKIVIHPPAIEKCRAHCHLDSETTIPIELRAEQSYLRRNKDIVDETDLLIAAPSGPEEQRSGTWSTIRYALKNGKSVYILGWAQK